MIIIVFPVWKKLTSVLFLERPLAQYGDGELKGEHTNVASTLAAKEKGNKNTLVKSYNESRTLGAYLRFNLCYCSRFMGYLIRKKVLYAIKVEYKAYLQGKLWHYCAFVTNKEH